MNYHIAITIDKNYSTHGAVMLYSLLSNNNPENLHIHIIKDFQNFILDYPIKYVLNHFNCKFSVHIVSAETLGLNEDYAISLHATKAVYYRLFLSRLLPEIDRVLFLDSDLIVDGNIQELFETSIQNHPLAAVIINNDERIKTLELKNGYFNSGVMLLNLAYIRENMLNIAFQIFMKDNKEKIIYWDQDVLNYTTNNTFKPLDCKWNYISETQECETAPIILHFAGKHKPWHHYSTHSYRNRYFDYLKMDRFLNFIIQFLEKLKAIHIKFSNKLKNRNLNVS